LAYIAVYAGKYGTVLRLIQLQVKNVCIYSISRVWFFTQVFALTLQHVTRCLEISGLQKCTVVHTYLKLISD